MSLKDFELAPLNMHSRIILVLFLSLPALLPVISMIALWMDVNEGAIGIFAILFSGSLYLGGIPYLLFIVLYIPMTVILPLRLLLFTYLLSPMVFSFIVFLLCFTGNTLASTMRIDMPIIIPDTATGFFGLVFLGLVFSGFYVGLSFSVILFTPLRHLYLRKKI